MINSTERSDIHVFNCYLCHVRFLLTCYVCSTKIGEISDISKCFENFVSQTLGVLTRIYAAELRVDNNIGSATIAKINEVKDQKLLLHEIAMRRKKYYESLVEKDFTQEVFLDGWLNRVDDCLQRKL